MGNDSHNSHNSLNSLNSLNRDNTGGLLLIEGNPADAMKVLEALPRQEQLHVEWAKNLSEGLQRLEQPGIVAILVNLFLPDSQGIDRSMRCRLVHNR